MLCLVHAGEYGKQINDWKCPLKYINAIANTLLTFNSSINFLIYCLIGRKFRTILAEMCCCCCNKYCKKSKAKVSSGNDPLLLMAAETVPLQSYKIMVDVTRGGSRKCVASKDSGLRR